MKKLISLVAAMIFLVICFAFSVSAEETLSATLSVTIANKGELAVVLDEVTVTDIDGDGALTVNDALSAAHEANYEGGAEAGYAFAKTDYGLSVTKLWGDTSGSYGYYNNNASAWSLLDTVKDGDSVYAFVYTDGASWSDTYSFFNMSETETEAGKAVELTLSAAGYDENWNPVTVAVEGATITVDGVATEIKTDAEGKATVIIDKAGTVVISATSETLTLVPPVCVATVKGVGTAPESTPSTGDSGNIFAVIAVIAIVGVAVISMKKRVYEK